MTLGRESPVGDTLIVKLNPLDREGVPMSAREIAARINQITFGQPMLRDVELIETARRVNRGLIRARSGADARLARHRFHLIEAGRFTGALAPESKGQPDMQLLTYLHDAGRSETGKWLERNASDIGRRSTVDLGAHFLAPRSPLPPVATGAPTQAA